jgi:hypothetical protein
VKAAAAAGAAVIVLFFAAAGAQQAQVAGACTTTTTTDQTGAPGAPPPPRGHYGMRALAALWVSVGGPTGDANGDGYPEPLESAAIATAESGGDPNIRNGIGATGLWQIYNGPGTDPALRDPVLNARAAVAKFEDAQRTEGDGWVRWTTYTGADTPNHERTFLRYLKGAPAVSPTQDVADIVGDAACAPSPALGGSPGTATAGQVAGNANVVLQPGVTLDRIDPRILGLLAWIGRDHKIIVTALRNGGHVAGSNHYSGRAVDVGMVDSHGCFDYTAADSCGQLAIAVAALPAAQRPTEILACFDPDGPGPAQARADHCDHLHLGIDA